MKTAVYIAGRTEDQAVAVTLRERLARHGIACTSTWLGPNGIIPDLKKAALICLQDIARADAVVIVNPEKVHRTGTGGRHTEVGIAIGTGKPVVVIGKRENVFHHLDLVRCVPPTSEGGSMTEVVAAIRELVAPRDGAGELEGPGAHEEHRRFEGEQPVARSVPPTGGRQ